MRYAERVEILSETGGGYNPDTGRHETPVVTAVTLPCNVSTLGVDRTRELFGNLDVERIVVRLQQPFEEPVSRMVVDGRRYSLTQRVLHHPRTAFYLEEIQ